jgi:hypothetical protein
MDPYVKVFLGTQHQQTHVARQEGKHPIWRDELTLHYYNRHDDDVLKFEVWDEDTHKEDDLVGIGSLAVATVLLKGSKMQTWVQLSYKGKSAGQILVDATFIPKNEINQQNQAQLQNQNMIMVMMVPQNFQPNYQGGYPMMSASQGMVSRHDSFQQQMQQQNFVRQSSYPNQGLNPQQVQGQPGFSQQMSMQPQYQSQNSFQFQQPNLTQQHSCPPFIFQQVQGQLGFSQQLQMQPRYQSQPSLVTLNSFPNQGSSSQQGQVQHQQMQVQPQFQQQNSVQHQSSLVQEKNDPNQGSPSQQVQVQSEIPQKVQVQPQNQQPVYVKQESYVIQNSFPEGNSIQFVEGFVLRGV